MKMTLFLANLSLQNRKTISFFEIIKAYKEKTEWRLYLARYR
jgi:hypothetical protein